VEREQERCWWEREREEGRKKGRRKNEGGRE
jgi:hypothetical protein